MNHLSNLYGENSVCTDKTGRDRVMPQFQCKMDGREYSVLCVGSCDKSMLLSVTEMLERKLHIANNTINLLL